MEVYLDKTDLSHDGYDEQQHAPHQAEPDRERVVEIIHDEMGRHFHMTTMFCLLLLLVGFVFGHYVSSSHTDVVTRRLRGELDELRTQIAAISQNMSQSATAATPVVPDSTHGPVAASTFPTVTTTSRNGSFTTPVTTVSLPAPSTTVALNTSGIEAVMERITQRHHEELDRLIKIIELQSEREHRALDIKLAEASAAATSTRTAVNQVGSFSPQFSPTNERPQNVQENYKQVSVPDIASSVSPTLSWETSTSQAATSAPKTRFFSPVRRIADTDDKVVR